MKLSIRKVSNGYILKWVNMGMSPLKEPYDKDEVVFLSLDSLFKYLNEVLNK